MAGGAMSLHSLLLKHAGRSVKKGGDFSKREKSPVTVTCMYVIVFLYIYLSI